jgi:hypothetical protein
MIRRLYSYQKLTLYCIAFLIFFLLLLCINKRPYKISNFETNEDHEIIETIANNYEYTTVISMYFNLEKSKHTHDRYQIWIVNTLTSIKAPMIIFTDNKSKDYIYFIRSSMNYNTKIIVYENVWQIMRELELKRNKSYVDEYLNGNHSKNNYYRQDLYATWNIKAYLSNKAVKINPYNSTFFIYTDIGAFRSDNNWNESISIPEWPDNSFVKELNVKLKNKILLGQIDFGDYKTIEGGFFCGNKKAFQSFEDMFYEEHDLSMKNGLLFSGLNDDQTLMGTLAFKTNKNMFVLLNTYYKKCDRNYDPWFFYQHYLAHKEYYICDDDKFSLLLNL